MKAWEVNLKDFSSEELVELKNRIDHEITIKNKLEQNKKQEKICVGDAVSFVHSGKTILGKVVRINAKTISIETTDDTRWRVPCEMLNKINNNTVADKIKNEVGTNNTDDKFSVGEKVFFKNKQGDVISGVVTKVNPKTIGVETDNNGRWRVSPKFLYRDISTENKADKEELFCETYKGGYAKSLEEMKKNFQIVKEQDKEAKKNGKLVGRYIQEQIADGHAIYQIIGESKKKVDIKVVTGIGDDWTVPYFGGKTTIDKDYAMEKLNWRDRISRLFADNKNKVSDDNSVRLGM